MGYLSILLQNEHWRPVYRPFAGAATGRWLAITGALAVMYGESLRRDDLPRRAADERSGKRYLRPTADDPQAWCWRRFLPRWRHRRAHWLLPLVSGAFQCRLRYPERGVAADDPLLLIACPLLPFLLIFFKEAIAWRRARAALGV
ncbi:hypothetical protein MJ575_22945 [Klebsiella pneumoniae]|nr:hypothetical protein MJ575_22945 [Klebsiella pneumoniae]